MWNRSIKFSSDKIRPVRLFATVLLVVFLCEGVVMVLLHALKFHGHSNILIDPIFLTILVVPLLYGLIVHPLNTMIRHIREINEDLQVQTQRAEAASRNKSEFLANMSHEIRTPMNSILGFSDLLIDEVERMEHVEYLRIIRTSGHALLQIINDILDYSKIESGKIHFDRIECGIDEVVRSVITLFGPSSDEKGLELKLDLHPDLPKTFVTDPLRLSQCLINLVGNAIKFTETGSICIRLYPETIDSNPGIRFNVEDTGVGIPPDKQALIFEPFQQADNSTAQKHGGTGLGLTITRYFVTGMGGTLTLKSQPGQGTIFSFVLPVAPSVTDTCDPETSCIISDKTACAEV